MSAIQGIFSIQGSDSGYDASSPPQAKLPDNGYHGCHFLFAVNNPLYPDSDNTLYLDHPTSPNSAPDWGGDSSPVGNGGHDLSNGYCTIHAAQSNVTTVKNVTTLRLNIEFLHGVGAPQCNDGECNKRYIYVSVTETSTAVIRRAVLARAIGALWRFWGWWLTP